MKQTEVYERISIILSLAKGKTFTWEDFRRRMDDFSWLRGKDGQVSKRTFQRDLNEIKEMHGIEIRFNKKIQKYEVDENESVRIQMNLLESFDMIHAFQMNKSIEDFVIFEERRSRGTEHLFGIVHAIQNTNTISLDYQSFTSSTPKCLKVAPLALKEFKNRWYLIGKKLGAEIRVFALDRIQWMSINSTEKFREKGFDVRKYYDGVFGISNELDQPVEEVELIIGKLKAQYIKSMPFHSSQVVVSEGEEGVRVQLQVKINYDFVSEILSHGDEIIVVRPAKLKDAVLERAKNIVRGYLRHE